MDGHNGMKPSESNPSTTVHKLVSSLNVYQNQKVDTENKYPTMFCIHLSSMEEV